MLFFLFIRVSYLTVHIDEFCGKRFSSLFRQKAFPPSLILQHNIIRQKRGGFGMIFIIMLQKFLGGKRIFLYNTLNVRAASFLDYKLIILLIRFQREKIYCSKLPFVFFSFFIFIHCQCVCRVVTWYFLATTASRLIYW